MLVTCYFCSHFKKLDLISTALCYPSPTSYPSTTNFKYQLTRFLNKFKAVHEEGPGRLLKEWDNFLI